MTVWNRAAACSISVPVRSSATSCSRRDQSRVTKTRPRCSRQWASVRSTVDTTTHKLATPFMVIATQNPIEHEGTYPCPRVTRSLLDEVSIGYPARSAELDILDRHGGGDPLSEIEAVPPPRYRRRIARDDRCPRIGTHAPLLRGYIVDIAETTRRPLHSHLACRHARHSRCNECPVCKRRR